MAVVTTLDRRRFDARRLFDRIVLLRANIIAPVSDLSCWLEWRRSPISSMHAARFYRDVETIAILNLKLGRTTSPSNKSRVYYITRATNGYGPTEVYARNSTGLRSFHEELLNRSIRCIVVRSLQSIGAFNRMANHDHIHYMLTLVAECGGVLGTVALARCSHRIIYGVTAPTRWSNILLFALLAFAEEGSNCTKKHPLWNRGWMERPEAERFDW